MTLPSDLDILAAPSVPLMMGESVNTASGSGEHVAVARVEGAHDLARQLQVRRLVLAHGHVARLVDGDVRGLQHRVGQQREVDVVGLVALLLLERWASARPRAWASPTRTATSAPRPPAGPTGGTGPPARDRGPAPAGPAPSRRCCAGSPPRRGWRSARGSPRCSRSRRGSPASRRSSGTRPASCRRAAGPTAARRRRRGRARRRWAWQGSRLTCSWAAESTAPDRRLTGAPARPSRAVPGPRPDRDRAATVAGRATLQSARWSPAKRRISDRCAWPSSGWARSARRSPRSCWTRLASGRVRTGRWCPRTRRRRRP